ncbi:MAG: glycosyltransferase family 39 protein [Victivallales bacterium]|jgi:hypothetical protein
MICCGFLKGECKKNSWSGILPPLLCFIVTFCWSGIFACIGLDVHHDGIMMKPAADVAGGQVLFRDTFTQYGALTTFIQALALKVFGPYLIVIRLTTVLFYSLSAVLLYYIWRNFLSASSMLLMYGLFLLLAPYYSWTFIPWSSIYALFFMLLANLSMIDFIKRGSVWLLLGAGASSALAFWCRQPNGIVMYLAIFLYFATCLALERKSWRKILGNFGVFTAAYAVSFSFFLLYLLLDGALKDWYIQSIKFMFTFGIEGRESASLFKCLVAEGFRRGSIFMIFPLATLSVFCVTLYLMFNRKRDGNRTVNLMLTVTAVIGLASWHQFFPVFSGWHCYWAAIPMFGFYAFSFQEISKFSFDGMQMDSSKQLPRPSKLLLPVVILNLLLIVIAIAMPASWEKYFPASSWDYCWMAIFILGFYAFAVQRIVASPDTGISLHLSKLLTRFSKLLLAVILLMPFYSMPTMNSPKYPSRSIVKMLKDVEVNLAGLPERKVFYDSPLKYMLLSNEEYHFFQSFRYIIGQMPPEFAGRWWINLSGNAFFSLYFPNGDNLLPMHVNWGNTVYPDYFDKVNHVLEEARPIVISYEKSNLPGYSRFAVIENTRPRILYRPPDAKAVSAEQGVEEKQKNNSVVWQVPASLSQRDMPFSYPLFFYLPDIAR